MNSTKKICDECESGYLSETSKMTRLCPNCAHHLYGYENCNHVFENGRCKKCYWDGTITDFIKNKIKTHHNKS